MEAIHLFEQAGLGQAPYEYLYCLDGAKTNCQFCNTGIRYRFYLKSKDGKTFFVGSDCIYKSGDRGLTKIAKTERSRIAKEQRDAKKQKKREEREAKRKEILNQKIENFYQDNASIKYAFDWANNTPGLPQQLMSNLTMWGNLTDKQIELICKLYHEAQTIRTKCPTGKLTVEGTVKSFKTVQGFHGFVLKMIVESNEGFRVFGTVPGNFEGLEVGDKVRFVANIEPSKDDEYFGFYSRPSKAEYILPTLT